MTDFPYKVGDKVERIGQNHFQSKLYTGSIYTIERIENRHMIFREASGKWSVLKYFKLHQLSEIYEIF